MRVKRGGSSARTAIVKKASISDSRCSKGDLRFQKTMKDCIPSRSISWSQVPQRQVSKISGVLGLLTETGPLQTVPTILSFCFHCSGQDNPRRLPEVKNEKKLWKKE